MPAPYPLPNNITDIASFGDYTNLVTNNLFGISILLVTAFVFFTILSIRYSTRTSVMATGVITALMSIIWRFAGQINDFVMFTTIVVCGLGSLLFWYLTRQD